MTDEDASCPVPASRYDEVVLGHGSGGRLSADLLEHVFLDAFGDIGPDAREDSAIVETSGARIAITTDSFVVSPWRFPGGDIGSLAVYGTVNDLAVSGAIPEWITAAFILEEGLPLAELASLARSMRDACVRAGVRIVAGDTKVVDRGNGDGIFINTTGVGRVPVGRALTATAIEPGDVVLVSGTMGDHGVAILSVREGLTFDGAIESDAAPLHDLVASVLDAAPHTRCLRDPTRGGLASALNEFASASGVGIRIDEAAVPVHETVRGACEMLGLDPFYVANEGKLVAVVPQDEAAAALAAMRAHPLGAAASQIGEATEPPIRVVVETSFGTQRVLPLLSGEALPRIC